MEKIKKFFFGNKDKVNSDNINEEFLSKCKQNIIDLEIKVELYEIDFELIEKWVNNYIILIEYYMNNESNDYLYYKNKMKELLTKPKITNILNNKKQENNLKSKYKFNPENKLDKQLFHQLSIKQKEFNKKVDKKKNKDNIKDIVNIIENNIQETNKIIQTDLNNQKMKLFEKLKKRKLNISQKKSFTKDILSIQNSFNINDDNNMTLD